MHPVRTVGTAAVATAIFFGTASGALAAGCVTLSEGHVDVVDVAYEAGELELAIHDEGTDTEFAPAEVVLAVGAAARTTVPDDPAYGFLGTPGAAISVLPAVQQDGLLFAGLAAEEVPTGTFVGDDISISVSNVRGPDGFSLFTENADGSPAVLVDSEDGLPDSFTLEAGSHQHANWGFEAPGTYRITYTASGVLVGSGTTVTSAPATVTIKVK